MASANTDLQNVKGYTLFVERLLKAGVNPNVQNNLDIQYLSLLQGMKKI